MRLHPPAGDRAAATGLGSSAMNAIIGLTDVTKRYSSDGAPAVDAVSLRVAAGEAVAVMGPSGSGKSTLLNMIAQIDVASGGEILFAGDMIVVNDISSGVGFDTPDNEVTVLSRDGSERLVSRTSKKQVAQVVLDEVERLRRFREEEGGTARASAHSAARI